MTPREMFWLVLAVSQLVTAELHAHEYPITFSTNGQIRFIENKNQLPDAVRFHARVPGGDLYLENTAFTYYIFNTNDLKRIHPLREDSVLLHGHSWKEEFVGANPSAEITAVSPSSYTLNYFHGNDRSKWASDVRDFAQVTYTGLYERINMNVYAFGPNLKYDLIVEPGGDPSRIRIRFSGLDRLSIHNGALLLETSIGTFTEQKPYAYQVVNGEQRAVGCRFRLSQNEVTFDVYGRYDSGLPLIIDPTLIFASYTGSTADNFGYTASYDNSGSMYLGGLVNGAGYPTTTGAVQLTFGGGSTLSGNQYPCDFAIMKLSSMGNDLLWATYLGGSNNETPHSLIVDHNGDLLIYGRTWSNNFPVTSNAFDQSYNGSGDITVSKINSAGNSLLASTYVGGSGMDGVNYDPTEPGNGNLKVNYGDDARGEIIHDASNNVYVATCTYSTNFPISATAFQTTSGGGQEAIVFKMNPDLTTILWGTYLGGSADDACYSLDVFGTEVYAAGGTMSANFPTTSSALHSSFRGGAMDGFVVHLSSDGSALLDGSFIGTNEDDQVYFVKLDKNSNVYLYGQTTGNYPVTAGTYSNPNSGQFIHKLDAGLASSIYSTVFGNGNGEPNISPTAFAVDTCENLYISGWGGTVFSLWSWFSWDMNGMPITADAIQSTTDGTDFYIAVFKKNMTELSYATYYGGFGPTDVASEHVDGGTSRFDKNGIIYQAICAGCGGTSLTPTTPGAWSETNQSSNCNELGLKLEVNLFVVTAALEADPTATGCVPLTVQFINNSINATQYEWDFGDGGNSAAVNPVYTYTDTGTFEVRLVAYDPTACVPYDTAYTTVIVYNTFVDASFDSTVTDFCDSIQVDLVGLPSNASTVFSYDFGDGTVASGLNASYTYTEPGLYVITITVNDPSVCNPLDTFLITIDFTKVVFAELEEQEYFGCPPLLVTFQNTGYGGITFFWDFGDGTTSDQANPSHTYSIPGIYEGMLIVGDPSACKPFDTVLFTVTVFDYPPQAAFSADPTVIIDYISEVQFTNLSQGATYYYWTFGDGDTSTQVNPVHTYDFSGTYLACLNAYNEGGCPDTACVIITVQLIPVVDVPNAFSPNGDGANDVLYVKGQDVANLSFKVFNRWGELVFETNNMNIGWDGLYKGEPQEMEVYVWMLNAVFADGKAAVRSGNVTLLR